MRFYVIAETATGSAVELYAYDTYNRLTSYESGDTYAEYGYNAEDYRCYKNVQENGFFDETYYFYEGSHVIMEADSTGTINAHNMYGTHLAARTVDGQSCYYLYNAHGDVVMLMDAVTGEVAGTYQYDAFGTLLWSDGYADNSITYAGYQYDEESGLYYLNARYYDSTTARFLTEDTYRGRQNDPLSLNRYTYCQNNPVHYTDPSGHGFLAALGLKFAGGAILNGAIELASQVFIEKRDKVDWKAVGFEALVGGVEGVFGGTGGRVVKKFAGEVLEETVEYGFKKTAKKVTGVVVHDAVSGFATDVAYQKVFEDKSWDEIDYGSAVKSAAADGLMGGAIELGSDVLKFWVGSFSTSKRNVDIDVDTSKKKIDTPSTQTDTSTQKNVDIPESEPTPKSTGADFDDMPNTSKEVTGELDELGDSVPSGSKKMNLQFFADDSVKSSGNSDNYVYRALNKKDYECYINGLGLEAKNPNGNWSLKEHLVNGSGRASWAKDPYISTTSDLSVALEFNRAGNGYGVVKIDMNKVTSASYKGYEIYPRVNGEDGLPYYYSIWQQEISVYQNIPFEAIVDYLK